MSTIWLEFGDDFALNPQGGLLCATGFDETRQVIERAAFTTPQTTLADGSIASAEYYLDTGFGEGLRIKIGSLPLPQALQEFQRGMRVAAASAPSVDQTQPVQFSIVNSGNIVYITVTIPLVNGKTKSTTYSIGTPSAS